MRILYMLLFGVLACSLEANEETKEWKDRAIQEISKQVEESKEPKEEENWLTQEWIICKNGEWVAYRAVDGSHPWHENSADFASIFICYTSDKKWYYSTYHFCIGMTAFRHRDEQPESLNEFIANYWLQPFDGKSDEALKSTRPPIKGVNQSELDNPIYAARKSENPLHH